MTAEDSKKHTDHPHSEENAQPDVEETLAERVDEEQPLEEVEHELAEVELSETPEMKTSEHKLGDLVSHPHIPYLGSKPAPTTASFLTSSKKSSDKGHVIQLLILMVIGAGVVAATVYLLRGGTLFDMGSNTTATPSPSAVASAEPTPLPSPSPSPQAVDRSAYTVRVLNGTGKSGLAAKIAGQLKGLGYKTEKVGNATNSAFKQTVVRVKSGEDALLENLIKDLSTDFEPTDGTTLKSSESVDAEIILGAK